MGGTTSTPDRQARYRADSDDSIDYDDAPYEPQPPLSLTVVIGEDAVDAVEIVISGERSVAELMAATAAAVGAAHSIIGVRHLRGGPADPDSACGDCFNSGETVLAITQEDVDKMEALPALDAVGEDDDGDDSSTDSVDPDEMALTVQIGVEPLTKSPLALRVDGFLPVSWLLSEVNRRMDDRFELVELYKQSSGPNADMDMDDDIDEVFKDGDVLVAVLGAEKEEREEAAAAAKHQASLAAQKEAEAKRKVELEKKKAADTLARQRQELEQLKLQREATAAAAAAAEAEAAAAAKEAREKAAAEDKTRQREAREAKETELAEKLRVEKAIQEKLEALEKEKQEEKAAMEAEFAAKMKASEDKHREEQEVRETEMKSRAEAEAAKASAASQKGKEEEAKQKAIAAEDERQTAEAAKKKAAAEAAREAAYEKSKASAAETAAAQAKKKQAAEAARDKFAAADADLQEAKAGLETAESAATAGRKAQGEAKVQNKKKRADLRAVIKDESKTQGELAAAQQAMKQLDQDEKAMFDEKASKSLVKMATKAVETATADRKKAGDAARESGLNLEREYAVTKLQSVIKRKKARDLVTRMIEGLKMERDRTDAAKKAIQEAADEAAKHREAAEGAKAEMAAMQDKLARMEGEKAAEAAAAAAAAEEEHAAEKQKAEAAAAEADGVKAQREASEKAAADAQAAVEAELAAGAAAEATAAAAAAEAAAADEAAALEKRAAAEEASKALSAEEQAAVDAQRKEEEAIKAEFAAMKEKRLEEEGVVRAEIEKETKAQEMEAALKKKAREAKARARAAKAIKAERVNKKQQAQRAAAVRQAADMKKRADADKPWEGDNKPSARGAQEPQVFAITDDAKGTHAAAGKKDKAEAAKASQLHAAAAPSSPGGAASSNGGSRNTSRLASRPRRSSVEKKRLLKARNSQTTNDASDEVDDDAATPGRKKGGKPAPARKKSFMGSFMSKKPDPAETGAAIVPGEFHAVVPEKTRLEWAFKEPHVDRLSNYEVQRRKEYDEKNASNHIYWATLQALLKKGFAENERAVVSVKKKIVAEKAHVEALSKLKEQFVVSSGGGRNDANKPGPLEPSMQLSSKYQGIMGECVTRLVDILEHEVLQKELRPATTRYSADQKTILKEGLKLLDCCHYADSVVALAYKAYSAVVEVHGGDARRSAQRIKTAAAPGTQFKDDNKPAAKAAAKKAKAKKDAKPSRLPCMWLATLQYAAAVRHMEAVYKDCFDAARGEMSKLVMLEVARRQSLARALSVCVSAQNKLLPGVPAAGVVQQQVEEWADRAGRDAVHSDCTALSAAHGDKVKKAHEKQHGGDVHLEIDKLGEISIDFDGVDNHLLLQSLQADVDPTGHKLLCYGQVCECGYKKKWRGFKVVLVCRTADNFLHVFTLPDGARLGASAKKAYESLVPRLKVVSGGSVKLPKLKGDLVAPALSIDLAKAAAQLRDLPGEDFDEILVTECKDLDKAAKASGAWASGKLTLAQITLRSLKKEEMEYYLSGGIVT